MIKDCKIEEMNLILQRVGSNFRTADGITFIAHMGKLSFLKKSYTDIEDAYAHITKLEPHKK